MRPSNIKISQIILNKFNSKEEFTFYLTDETLETDQNNYIVSVENIALAKNPSLAFDALTKIQTILDTHDGLYESIGCYFDTKNQVYSLDANVHFYSLALAKIVGKEFNQLAIYDIKNKTVINL